jgi:hypothetical protein
VGRISGVEKLEEFDELAAAVAVADECMDLAILLITINNWQIRRIATMRI